MLPEKMLALVAHGIHDYRVEEVPTPRALGADVIMKIEACGICAGDIKCYEGGTRFWGGDLSAPYCEPPFIPGHEVLGHIAEIGPDYQGSFKIGDRVTVEQIVPCGECKFCKDGKYTLCVNHDVFGFKSRLNGGCADYMRVPENARLHAIPESLKPEQAVLTEPFACAIHAVDRARVTENDVVVIAGAGAIGLGMVAAAKRLKPKALVCIDPTAWLREKAKDQGATHTLDVWYGPGMPPLIASLTDGYGCDVYIDATGHPSGVIQGLKMIQKGGRFVEFSVFNEPTTVDWSVIGDMKEIEILGASLSPDCFPRAIQGIADGSLETFGVVTNSLPLCMFDTVIEVAHSREGIKAMLKSSLDRLIRMDGMSRLRSAPHLFKATGVWAGIADHLPANPGSEGED